LRILLLILIAVIVFTAYTLGQVSVARGSDSVWSFMFGGGSRSKADLVVTTLRLLKARYYMPIEDDEPLVYGALTGMLASLHRAPYSDPYSGFLDPAGWDTLKATTGGGYAGVGILIGPSPTHPYPVVVTVFPDSPAEQAGLHENDLIIEADGKSTEDMLIDEVAALIKGEVGTEISLRVARENLVEPLEFTLKRAVIELHTVPEHRILDDATGYLRIIMFSETTLAEVKEVLDEFVQAGVKGLIIDLRSNTGGLLVSAVAVADLFIKQGVITSVETRGGVAEIHQATPTTKKYDFDIALLVNGHTASAAEILAGALRDHGLGVLVGEKTFGKGVVQEVIELDGGRAALVLTIGKYLTPGGHDLGGAGLEPDVKVTYDDYKKNDAELARLEALLTAKNEEIRGITGQMLNRLREVDYQLQAGQAALRARRAQRASADAA